METKHTPTPLTLMATERADNWKPELLTVPADFAAELEVKTLTLTAALDACVEALSQALAVGQIVGESKARCCAARDQAKKARG